MSGIEKYSNRYYSSHEKRHKKHDKTSIDGYADEKKNQYRNKEDSRYIKDRYLKKYDQGDSPVGKKKTKKTKKSKKKKTKEKNSSNSSSDELDDELELLKMLEQEKNKSKEEQNRKKQLIKQLETPEEKRLRRLNKKEAKERKRKSKMGWDEEYLHLTNEDNPYGDSSLLETFCWKKKLEKEGLNYLSKEEIEQRTRSKMEENRLELEKVKKRRLEREREKMEREKMLEMEMRQKEAAQFSHFSSQEDSFQLLQARLRSQIRIQDGRAKPIDLLAQYVSSEGDVNAVDMLEPYSHLRGLTLGDLEDLLEDIKVYKRLEDKDENQVYWNDLIVIVEDELRRLRLRDASASEEQNNRQGIHASITDDVTKVFLNKSARELDALRMNIENKLAGPTSGLDVGYWESLLSQLKAHQARASLRERHRDNLKKKLRMLKEEQGVEDVAEAAAASSSKEESKDYSERHGMPCGRTDDIRNEDLASDEELNEDTENKDGGEGLISSSISSYESGRYSPELLSYDSLGPAVDFVDPEEDLQRLLWARGRILGNKEEGKDVTMTSEEKMMHKEAQTNMTNDEVQFSVEANLDPKTYIWSDKYRPRKPRYFNRVHTGFEWNKYNQTHYDMDNPPPKIVQGYKFNIFYPDLIDKSKTPQYELIPCTDNKDFTILKFTASPPYEDIAFKIVSREWEYSYKRGFRCQFHNNIFQLWFHFKRYRYRR